MKPSNLLFILSDEHSRRVLGCYGHPTIRTPNLDRLAAGGVRFTDAYCNSPICVPSRAALATGRYVHDIRFWDNAIAYDGSVPSWHHRLRDAGPRVDLDRQIALPQRRRRQRLHRRGDAAAHRRRDRRSARAAPRPLAVAQGFAADGERGGVRRLELPAIRRQDHRGGDRLAERARRTPPRGKAVGAVRVAGVPAFPADRAPGMVRALPGGQVP